MNEEAIFEQALGIQSAQDRDEFLRGACAGDDAMLQRLQGLLRAHARAGRFLEHDGRAAAEPGATLKSLASAASAAATLTEQPGDHIGRYKLLQKIGEGGCGVVYMAEQEEPVRRRVALKIIKLGMDTRSVIARFEAERQALAMMDHPNIAKAFDAGATEGRLSSRLKDCDNNVGAPISADPSAELKIVNRKSQIPAGRPYFVMELVRGIKITEFCDQNNLSTGQRLDLFIQVCDAVQHAHQKGVIHRDLKPSNILVTLRDGVPVPKVIDFGIAKATTDQRLTDKTLFTAFEQFIGTPAYMSPEQAEMSELGTDTRSDIYSLGVLLYELLTGQTPFDTKELLKAGLDEMRRTIREVEPVKPSTRLTQELTTAGSARLPRPERHERGEGLGRGVPDGIPVGSEDTSSPRPSQPLRGREGGNVHRVVQLKELIPLLRGDLDWIVMKCLEKNRARRYETANGLASDIQRHLNNEPVVACPPSSLYKFQKLVRRNKVAVAAGASVAAALVLGLCVATWGLVREREARKRAVAAERDQIRLRQQAQANEQKARTEAVTTKQVAQFLESMLEGVGPEVAKGRDATLLKEILDKTAERIGTELADVPKTEAYLRDRLGRVYQALGDYPTAELMQRRVLDLRRQLYPDGHRDVAEALNNLAITCMLRGRLPEAETLSREALAMGRKFPGPYPGDPAAWRNNLATILRHQGKSAEAAGLYREALELNRKLLGNEHREVAVTLNNLALALFVQGKLDEAEPLLREALEMSRKLFGNPNPLAAQSLTSLTPLLKDQGKLQEAEAVGREAVALQKSLNGSEHPNVALSLGNLAEVLVRLDNLPEAESLHREALAIRRKKLGPEHPVLARSLYDLGFVLNRCGKAVEAEAMLREALAMAIKFPGNEDVNSADILVGLNKVLANQGKPPEPIAPTLPADNK